MLSDPVNHPSHYAGSKYEVIEFIEDAGFTHNYCLGNAVKYICRAGKKDPAKMVEDLEKALWYVERELAKRGPNGIPSFSYIDDFLPVRKTDPLLRLTLRELSRYMNDANYGHEDQEDLNQIRKMLEEVIRYYEYKEEEKE